MRDEPLDLVPTDDLLDELARRFDTMIFAGVRSLDGHRDHRTRHGTGEWLRQMGLACDYALYARETMAQAEAEGEP